jgi:hypothetical protein
MKGQTHAHSLIETIAGTAIGYVVAVASQTIIYPWFGVAFSFRENLTLAAIFTVISLARGYVVRRTFNRWHVRAHACRVGLTHV